MHFTSNALLETKSTPLLLEGNIVERLPVDLNNPVVDLDPPVAGDPPTRLHALHQQALVVPRHVRARDDVDAQRPSVVAQHYQYAVTRNQKLALSPYFSVQQHEFDVIICF